MKDIINKISRAVQVILLAPIKLPGKALNIIKYVAVGLGIIEAVLDEDKPEAENREQKGKERVNADIDVSEDTEEKPEPDRKEETDET
ncbi:hypothetical protein FAZ19_03915 [Sphingobacterium alkalisoli]|uniref:Uncharacterized protein n=1 Tax=Sphingobacterium alkalisoli TaxID=1874115 RepID=A0A4U0H988_9SPHI|nr:hypothetical protein [Sphingobacterium alkalisoli]TJY68410.1 hypothetical protein FAZ19_03915 [Sphingobacterium alkalisoli]GGH06697.1 hypothetical protein GCM10011418_03530 [Sphingobacterium alkalisoli]